MLQPVGKVRGVQQAERPSIEHVAFLGHFDRLRHEIGSGPAGGDDAIPLDLEPFLQQLDMRGAADAVGAFDRDEFALEVTRI